MHNYPNNNFSDDPLELLIPGEKSPIVAFTHQCGIIHAVNIQSGSTLYALKHGEHFVKTTLVSDGTKLLTIGTRRVNLWDAFNGVLLTAIPCQHYFINTALVLKTNVICVDEYVSLSLYDMKGRKLTSFSHPNHSGGSKTPIELYDGRLLIGSVVIC